MGLPVETLHGDADRFWVHLDDGERLDDASATALGLQGQLGASSSSRVASPRDRQPVTDAQGTGLTVRELDVLRLVAKGKTNAEIGTELSISAFTAKTHVANLLGKLRVENRASAAVWATRHGLAPVRH